MDYQRNENGERADEVKARLFVEKYFGIDLKYADFNGQVDYKFERDGQECAIEVSRFTEERQKNLWSSFEPGSDMLYHPPLMFQWLLSAKGMPRLNEVKARVLPALHILERYDLNSYWHGLHSWWFERDEELRIVSLAFSEVGIESAQSGREFFKHSAEQPFNVGVTFRSFWSYGNADSALEILENHISSTEDNRKKLYESKAIERHLWLWLDRHTVGGVLEAFKGLDNHLPTRKPNLPEEVTHLWFVNEENGYGWFFNPLEGWASLSELPITLGNS